VLSVAELLLASGSATPDVTETALLIVPGVFGITLMVTDAFPPLAMSGRLHVTVPLEFVQPADADPKLTLKGSVSVTRTPVAVSGPAFVTVIVYTSVLPTATGSGESNCVIDRSAAGAEVT
jgi:hypothetical protein